MDGSFIVILFEFTLLMFSTMIFLIFFGMIRRVGTSIEHRIKKNLCIEISFGKILLFCIHITFLVMENTFPGIETND